MTQKIKDIYREANLKPVKVTKRNATKIFNRYRKEFK